MIDGSGITGFAPRSLLPGELAAAGGSAGVGADARKVRRTFRDGVVDGLVFLGAVLLGLVMLGVVQDSGDAPAWFENVDPLLGLFACLALWWRRRFPTGVALVALPAIAMSASSFGAGMVVITNLALRVPWQRSTPVLCLYLVGALPTVIGISVPDGGGWSALAFTLAYYLLFFAWGSALRARRMLVFKLREDADRERADHARRLADARRAERRAIAREMHDVLAHRISLLSVHAGALAYRTRQTHAGAGPALSEAEVSESAQIIRGNAHQALEELREVLLILRSEGGEEEGHDRRTDGTERTAAPQPRLEDIRLLVEEARAAGQQVAFQKELSEEESSDGVPPRPQQQRTVHRVVQEGLTNARKHSPGSEVSVRLGGAPGSELTVEIRNPLPDGTAGSGIPGAGVGLTGLSERVELEGGTLEYDGKGGMFILRARLPWPAR